MKLTTHYYILSLSAHTSRLYEAFRDTLIDIQNTGFPIESSAGLSRAIEPALGNSSLREFIRTADQHFDHYFTQDPLRLVVAGEKECLSIFESLTSHRDVLIGSIEGDYATTSPHDLGKIAWPIVKDAMAGISGRALHDLEAAEGSRNVASGINAVGHVAGSRAGGTLFVEEDYHVKGGISRADRSLIPPEDLDVQEVIDDVVDAIIEKVLETDGSVIFLESGSLTKQQRIALILGN